jgi:alkylation response protein AidB-like acyl-CoA dehydrogenase
MIDYASLESAIGLNWWDVDPNLQRAVRRHCPEEDLAWARAKLSEFGALVGGRIARNADVIDANPPKLRRYDRWANEVNEIQYHPATFDSKDALWRVGYGSNFTADREERGRRTPSIVRMAVDYILSQADTGLACSVGQTNGAAKMVARYAPDEVREQLMKSLLANSLEEATDGAMFLTERDSGSDLGRAVHCTAREADDGQIYVSGEKWFCSNMDGDAILLLARPEGAPEGARNLGFYLVPRLRRDGTPNGIHLRRLKDKLGTRSVPSGEVVLEDALAYPLRGKGGSGGAGRAGGKGADSGGLNRMMEMVNGTRLGVAMMGLGIARRCFLESAIWAHHRMAKGRLLVDLPLVRQGLVDLLVELEGSMALGFATASIDASDKDDRTLRRAITSATKARLSRFGVQAATYAVELHGGNGYCEDWGLTRQLRDAQCNPIWEGTENICYLDTLRVMRDEYAVGVVMQRISHALRSCRSEGLGFTRPAADSVSRAQEQLLRAVRRLEDLDNDRAQVASAQVSELLASTVTSALLLEEAVGDPRKALVAIRYAQRHLEPAPVWDASIALERGREILSYQEIGEGDAAATMESSLMLGGLD